MRRERKCLFCEGFSLVEGTVSLMISSVMTAAVFSAYLFLLGSLSMQKERLEAASRRFDFETGLASFFQDFSLPLWTDSVEYGFSENEIFVRAKGCAEWLRFVSVDAVFLGLGFESCDGGNCFVVKFAVDGGEKELRFHTATCGRRING